MQCTAYWLVFHIKHCIVILSHIAFASASHSIVFPSASSPGDTSLAPPRNITTLVTSSSSAASMPRFVKVSKVSKVSMPPFVKVYQRAFCLSVGKIIFTPSHFPPGGICALCSLTWTNLTWNKTKTIAIAKPWFLYEVSLFIDFLPQTIVGLIYLLIDPGIWIYSPTIAICKNLTYHLYGGSFYDWIFAVEEL